MEKIYMEDNNSSNNVRNYKNKYHFSIVLSFVVAVFALVSLVVVGFNQVSFAASTYTNDKFTFSTGESIIAKKNGTAEGFYLPTYFALDGNGEKTPIFCIQHGVDVGNGAEYTKDKEIKDDGILYILNKSKIYNDDGPGIVPQGTMTDEDYNYVETYVTQVALWVYLNEKYPSTAEHKLDELETIKNADNYYLQTNGKVIYNSNLYEQYIKGIVKEAQTSSNVKTLSVKLENDTISEVSGTDYYQTSAVTVTGNPSEDLESYTIIVNGIDGAFAVDEDGAEIKNDSKSPSDKFYVRIPKNKVTDEAQRLTISVDGVFKNYLSGNEYVSAGKQTVVTVTSTKHVVSNGTEIEIVGAPDTGMSTAQTIYFIGLIVLLCGVGIIYASAKPIKNI